MIEKVISFGTKLQLNRFGEADVFLKRDIEFAEAGSDEGVAGRRSEGIERGQGKHRGIEPLLRGLGAVVGIA